MDEGTFQDEEQGPSSAEDLQTLRNTCLNERFAPELLPYDVGLIERVKQSLDEQMDRIAELSEENFLQRSVYEMERERVEYLVRAYLRNRLQKVAKFALSLSQDVDARSRLSEHEQEFLTGYGNLYKGHVDASIWQSADCSTLPEQVKELKLVPTLAVKPKYESHVFVRVRHDCDPFTISYPSGEEQVELHRGELVLLPYKPVAPLVLNGSVSLT